jgi:hypothetical protein
MECSAEIRRSWFCNNLAALICEISWIVPPGHVEEVQRNVPATAS